jgi:hypothetical protein
MTDARKDLFKKLLPEGTVVHELVSAGVFLRELMSEGMTGVLREMNLGTIA